MTTFALIHGGAHGGWCWEQLAPELIARGHQVIAPDLPIEDVDSGATQWAQTAVHALGGHDDVIVVAHSMGGFAAPVIAEMRPVRQLVFLGALVPRPGEVFASYLAEHAPDAIRFPFERAGHDAQGRMIVPREATLEYFFHDCPQDVAEAAWRRFRPQAFKVFSELCPLRHWPDVPCSYLLMREDRVLSTDWSRRVSLERFGKPAIELPGGHSPFYSRPKVLADALIAIEQSV